MDTMAKTEVTCLFRFAVAGRHIEAPFLLTRNKTNIAEIRYIEPNEYSCYDLGPKCSNSGETVCEVRIQRKCNEKIKGFLTELMSGKIVRLDTVGEIKYGFGIDGATTSEPQETPLPKNYQSFYDETNSSALSEAKRLVGLLQWTHGQAGWVNRLRLLDAVISLDETEWHPMPTGVTFRIDAPMVRGPKLDPLVLKQLYSAEENLPVYREILGEVEVSNMSRSSFMAMLGAVEIAIKTYISRHVPEATWLAMEAPTPPIVKIIQEYLPNIVALNPFPNRKDLIFSDRIVRLLRKGVQIRNTITHQGDSLPSTQIIEEIHLAINDVVATLEYCSGFEWAAEFVSNQTRVELGFPEIPIDNSTKILEENIFCTVGDHVRRNIKTNLCNSNP